MSPSDTILTGDLRGIWQRAGPVTTSSTPQNNSGICHIWDQNNSGICHSWDQNNLPRETSSSLRRDRAQTARAACGDGAGHGGPGAGGVPGGGVPGPGSVPEYTILLPCLYYLSWVHHGHSARCTCWLPCGPVAAVSGKRALSKKSRPGPGQPGLPGLPCPVLSPSPEGYPRVRPGEIRRNRVTIR